MLTVTDEWNATVIIITYPEDVDYYSIMYIFRFCFVRRKGKKKQCDLTVYNIMRWEPMFMICIMITILCPFLFVWNFNYLPSLPIMSARIIEEVA